MHNDDRDGSPERSGLVSCGNWLMPKLWSGGRANKISNKLAGDVACLGGSMVEHQPRLLGSRARFPAGAFTIFFPFLPKLHFQFPFLLSLSLYLWPFVCAKKRILCINPIKGEVRTINDRNICERRSYMKNNGKSPTFKFVSGEERRPSEVQRVSRGWRLPGATHSSPDLTWIRKWLQIQLRSCQSWKASSLSLGVVVPT